jgi:hypothetical protein
LISIIISLAASPTAAIVIAVKRYGSIAPNISPENSKGLRMFTITRSAAVAKAPNRARATKQAEPIAKPFPMAAVVFPAASRISEFSLAYSSPHISAIPPALSAIGPYPSIVNPIQRVESIPRAAKAIPYMSARLKETKIAMQIMQTGTKVE